VVWVLALGNLVVATGAFVVGGMIEPMSAALGLSVLAIGQLTAVDALANAVAAPMLLGLASLKDARFVLLFAQHSLASQVCSQAGAKPVNEGDGPDVQGRLVRICRTGAELVGVYNMGGASVMHYVSLLERLH